VDNEKGFFLWKLDFNMLNLMIFETQHLVKIFLKIFLPTVFFNLPQKIVLDGIISIVYNQNDCFRHK